MAAVGWAREEAVRRDLPLLVVRVWTDPIAAGYPLTGGLVGSFDQIEAEASQVAADVLKQASEQVAGVDRVQVQVAALRGGPGPALVHAASDATLLVVSIRSSSAVVRALLGSVSAHVLRHATCPVAVVPVPQPSAGAPRRVLVGVDHASSSEALLWATDEARRLDAVLVPVLVRDTSWDAPDPGDPSPLSLAQLEAAERGALQAAVPRDAGVRVEPEVVTGHAGSALVHLAAPQDVLVVGHHRRRAPLATLLGSTGVHVAEHARCPVVVVREPA